MENKVINYMHSILDYQQIYQRIYLEEPPVLGESLESGSRWVSGMDGWRRAFPLWVPGLGTPGSTHCGPF